MTVGHLREKLRDYKSDMPVYVMDTRDGSLFRHTLTAQDKCDEDPDVLHICAPCGPVQLQEDGWPCVVIYGKNR